MVLRRSSAFPRGAGPVARAEMALAGGGRRHGKAGHMAVESWEADGPGVLRLPSGLLVRGRGLRYGPPEGRAPTLGVYLTGTRIPDQPWEGHWVRWRDFWVPADPDGALRTLRLLHRRAHRERAEVACGGGVGRTGTALAALCVLEGLDPRKPSHGSEGTTTGAPSKCPGSGVPPPRACRARGRTAGAVADSGRPPRRRTDTGRHLTRRQLASPHEPARRRRLTSRRGGRIGGRGPGATALAACSVSADARTRSARRCRRAARGAHARALRPHP